jgi:hypothetical protein
LICSEERTITFLAGELTEAEAREFDAHLLGCETCWQAVQEDRQGRAAVQRLRLQAPAELADRVALAVGLVGDGGGDDPHGSSGDGDGGANAVTLPRSLGAPRPHRARRRALSLTSIAAGAVVLVGLWVGAFGPHGQQPPQLAVVLAAARSMTSSQPAGKGAELVAQHQAIDVRYYRVEDQPVLVATSERDFPMPKHMHMTGSTSTDWMATDGKLGIYCLNSKPGEESMLIVAAMPVEALPRVAADLHLL